MVSWMKARIESVDNCFIWRLPLGGIGDLGSRWLDSRRRIDHVLRGPECDWDRVSKSWVGRLRASVGENRRRSCC